MKSGGQRLGRAEEMLPLYWHVCSLLTVTSNSVDGSVATCLSFLTHQMFPDVWVVEITHVEALDKWKPSALLLLCLFTAPITSPGY